jgi:hypothetical protein
MTKREGLHDFLLRVPDELWAQFVKLSEQEDRTATQQLVHLIRQFVESHPPPQAKERRKGRK